LWIGFLIGWDQEYLLSSSKAVSVYTGDVRNSLWSIGIYNSSGSFPNDSITGSIGDSSYVSHSICVAHNDGPSNILKTTASLSGSLFFIPNFTGYLWKNNVAKGGGGSSNIVIPYKPDDYRYQIIRIWRSPSSVATTMSMQYAIIGNAEWTNDISKATSSALLAEAMKQTTWLQAETKLAGNYAGGSVVGGNSNQWYVNETLSGSFDKVFFSWNNSLSPWRIKDVVVRTSGSF
jgi:hypothetical protein